MTINRSSMMILFEVAMANPNGNPDWDNAPRELYGGRGWMSPPSLKRRLRDTLEDHESPCFIELMNNLGFNPENFFIFESKNRGFPELDQHEATKAVLQLAMKDKQEFFRRYWDARLFGCTFLQSKDKKSKNESEDLFSIVNTGCLTISPAISISPITVVEATLTKKSPSRDVKQDIAPSAYKSVRHGLYAATISLNPHYAHRTFATQQDVDVLKAVIPYMFQLTTANARPSSSISIVHAWSRDHKSALGSFNEYEFFKNLMPKKIDLNTPSESLDDYIIPDGAAFEAIDLMNVK